MIRSIRKRSTFDCLRSDGQRGRRGCLRITFLASGPSRPDDDVQLAFAISRKFGNAVERNRARRRLRAVFQHLDAAERLDPGMYLVIPHRSALTVPHEAMTADVEACLARVDALREPLSPLAGAGV